MAKQCLTNTRSQRTKNREKTEETQPKHPATTTDTQQQNTSNPAAQTKANLTTGPAKEVQHRQRCLERNHPTINTTTAAKHPPEGARRQSIRQTKSHSGKASARTKTRWQRIHPTTTMGRQSIRHDLGNRGNGVQQQSEAGAEVEPSPTASKTTPSARK